MKMPKLPQTKSIKMRNGMIRRKNISHKQKYLGCTNFILPLKIPINHWIGGNWSLRALVHRNTSVARTAPRAAALFLSQALGRVAPEQMSSGAFPVRLGDAKKGSAAFKELKQKSKPFCMLEAISIHFNQLGCSSERYAHPKSVRRVTSETVPQNQFFATLGHQGSFKLPPRLGSEDS